MRRRFFVMNGSVLIYTSSTQSKLSINSLAFNSSIKTHTYDEVGLIKFNGVLSGIGASIFNGSSLLLTCVLPTKVTKIGNEAFIGCTNLTSIVIPNSVTEIGESAFYSCFSLTSVTIPNGVTTIGNSAFRYCSSLTSITIPDRVTEIGSNAFLNCSGLMEVYCKATTPPYLLDSAFDDNASGRKIYVPSDSVVSYKTATNWLKYANAIIGYDFENDTVVGGAVA